MIRAEMSILEILHRYPQTKEVFNRHGMPCDRCMGAGQGSLADGSRMHGVPLTVLMRELERSILAPGESTGDLTHPQKSGCESNG